MGDYLYRVTKKTVRVYDEDGQGSTLVNLAEFYEKPSYSGFYEDRAIPRREKMLNRLWPNGLPAGTLVLEHRPVVDKFTPAGYEYPVYEWKAGALYWDYWNDRKDPQRPVFYVVLRGKKLYRVPLEKKRLTVCRFPATLRVYENNTEPLPR